MELTYEVVSNGYTIFKDGKAWIKQDGFIPYEASTIEDSAQLHIDDIIAQANKPEEPSEVAELQLAVAELGMMLGGNE